MKNKKILSVVLTVVMLLSLLPVNVFAAKRNEPIASGSLVLSETHMGKTVTGAIPQGLPEIKTAAATYKFYDNLTDFQKRIYNGFLATEGALGQNVKVVCSESELDIFDTEAIATNVYYALAAFFEDNPEYYWLLYAPLQFNITGQGSDYILELKLDYTVIPYSNEAEIRTEYNKTMQAVENFPVSGSTRYEKVKSINDGLCERATYADLSGEVSDKLFFPSSCLLPPYETVCDGYSKAFKLICDRENIPCIIVVGYGYVYNMYGELEPGGHAWNYVQMDDGKWYAVDVTWNDSAYDAGVYEYAYDYFLKGRNSIDSSGDRFAVTHDPVGDRFAVYDDYGNEKPICLTYPALSESEYDPNAVHEPIPDPSPDPIPDDPGNTVAADVNGDGKLSVVDAKWILQSLAGLRALSSTQNSAADVNGDGKLSVVDAKWILQALAGLRELGNVSPQPENPIQDDTTVIYDGVEVTKLPYTSNGLTITSISIETGLNILVSISVKNETGKAVQEISHFDYKCYDSNGNLIRDDKVYLEDMNNGETCTVEFYIEENTAKIIFCEATIYEDDITQNTVTAMYDGYEVTKLPYTSKGMTVDSISFDNSFSLKVTITATNNTGVSIEKITNIDYKCYDADENVIDSGSLYFEYLNDGEKCIIQQYFPEDTVKIILGEATIWEYNIIADTPTTDYDGVAVTTLPYTSNGITINSASFENNYMLKMTYNVTNNTGADIMGITSFKYKCYDKNGYVIDSDLLYLENLKNGESCVIERYTKEEVVKIIFSEATVYYE